MPKSEGVVTLSKSLEKSLLAFGDEGLRGLLQSKPFPVVQDQVVDFLDCLGREILRNDQARAFPDLMAFGFWCRRSNVLNETRTNAEEGIGVGVVLHIAPSNIPLVFGYSLALGLLAGNTNIVKLPSRDFPQVNLLVDLIQKSTIARDLVAVAQRIILLRASREDKGIEQIVGEVDGLIVWGGDTTVRAFRGMSKAPRCREVYFPDRKSATVLNANRVLSIGEKQMQQLFRDFFNDTYGVDQNACSSPTTVVWVGEPSSIRAAMDRFWSGLDLFLRVAYKSNSTVGLDKLLDVFSLVEDLGAPVEIDHGSNLIFRFTEDVARRGNLRFGQFYEASVTQLMDISERLRGDEQTVTYFGFSLSEMKNLLAEGKLIVDRICPVGHALDFGAIWDGKDVLGLLSRKLSIS